MTKLCGPQIFICEDTSKYPITALACTSSRLNLWSICRGLSLFHSCIETICMENYQTITSFVFISLRFLTASLLFHFDGGARSIPLYHIVILCLSQPRNVRRLPGPPVYTSFWGDGKPPWLGGPKAHSLMTSLYMLVSSHIISFFFRFTWKWDFATPPHRHMHTRYKVYVSRLLLRSYDFQWR